MRVLVVLTLAARLISAAQPVAQIFEKAVAGLAAGDYAVAESGFRNVLERSPEHVGALQNLGVVYSRTDRLPQAVAMYRRALELRPAEKSVLLNLGLAYMRLGAFGEALPVFQKLVEADPASLPARDMDLLYRLVVGYLKHDSSPDARRRLGTFLNSVPPAPASSALCRPYQESGDFDEAAAQCRRTLAADPNFAGAHLQLGKALVSQHSPEARQELEQAIRQDSAAPEAAYYLGVALCQEDHFADAVPYLERAAQSDPGFWGSYFYLGKAKLQLKQIRESVSLLRHAAELNPREPAVFYQLGRALTALGETAQAALAMERVREMRAAQLGKDAQALRRQ